MGFDFKKILRKHKNNKLLYYASGYTMLRTPFCFSRVKLSKILAGLSDYDKNYISDRVDYYNKLSEPCEISPEAIPISNLRAIIKPKVYSFDTLATLRYFREDLLFDHLFGDITTVPKYPSFLKSRPIDGDNQNSIVLKLNWIRHFIFVNRDISFEEKSDLLVWRGMVFPHQSSRIELLNRYIDSSECNVGQVNSNFGDVRFHKERLTISEQLQYKFVLSIEGNDVATNLKWILSSNSICVMSKPKYETWFMEGRLIAGYHYIEVKDDYSDLLEKVGYYRSNPAKAKAIIDNAHKFVDQFRDKKREKLISILVAQKYFKITGQL